MALKPCFSGLSGGRGLIFRSVLFFSFLFYILFNALCPRQHGDRPTECQQNAVTHCNHLGLPAQPRPIICAFD